MENPAYSSVPRETAAQSPTHCRAARGGSPTPRRAHSPGARGGDPQSSPLMVWSGRILSGSFALFLLGASATPKLLQLPVGESAMAELGWPPGHTLWIGLLELSCVVLYLIPRTSIFGAVVTMGLLGGAMATHIRAESPLFSHVLFSVYVGMFMWGGLWLRNPRLRELFPFVSKHAESP